jgi:hypothetical protein
VSEYKEIPWPRRGVVTCLGGAEGTGKNNRWNVNSLSTASRETSTRLVGPVSFFQSTNLKPASIIAYTILELLTVFHVGVELEDHNLA